MVTLEELTATVRAARTPLRIDGGGSKAAFYEPVVEPATALDVTGYRGIVEYEPTELVLRVRAGTPMAEIEQTLAAEGQMLGFEPPAYASRATIGGTIACGTSGSRRPWYGAARDFVLGVGLVTGKGDYVEFGGQVMKNVAGFDVSRLVCGSLGTLGVIADVSLKVLPAPETEVTVAFEADRRSAHRSMLDLSNRSLPVSGLAWFDEKLLVRLSGADAAVSAARREIGGDDVADPPWTALADHSFFGAGELWRVSVAPAATTLIDAARVIDWGGAQRWLVDPGFDPREALDGGHATLVMGEPASGTTRLQPLSGPVHAIHQRLKATLDPDGRLNPGRLYPEF